MANAASITLTDLVANGSVEEPTLQILDTGTADVVLETPATSEMDHIFIRIVSTAAEALVVTVSAGEDPPAWRKDPPAWRKDLGALADVTIAQNEIWFLGPFESARVGQADGKLQVTFAPGGTIAATFKAYQVPTV